jgi:dipeptidyl aminopeptidase/acylaminoacyl peptidase
MGLLGPHYEANSNYTAAHKLKGKLLLAHGEVSGVTGFGLSLRATLDFSLDVSTWTRR